MAMNGIYFLTILKSEHKIAVNENYFERFKNEHEKSIFERFLETKQKNYARTYILKLNFFQLEY